MSKWNSDLKRQYGFTVVELMITVGIVGILASVALPSYQQQVRKSGRADARVTLENLATAQELYFFRNNRYATKFADIRTVADSVLSLPSERGLYAITMQGDDFSWDMSATAVGRQAEDRQCTVLSLSYLGDHTALDADGHGSSCW